jgi:exodeoxyribonuclease V alpha subunit
MNRWHNYLQAWEGLGSLAIQERGDRLPEAPLSRLALRMLLEGTLDLADLREARWLGADEPQRLLLLFLQARLRRGQPRVQLCDLHQDLLTHREALPDLREGIDVASLFATQEADHPALEALWSRLEQALGSSQAKLWSGPDSLVCREANRDWISFASPARAQDRLLLRLRERLAHEPPCDEAHIQQILSEMRGHGLPLHAGQEQAVATALRHRTALIAGGPGTGKTTVVARVLEALRQLDSSSDSQAIALCAPTGRAKARLSESLSGTAGASIPAHTLHSLLGQRPDGSFRHNAEHPLSFRTVIVDEASMIDLSLFAALFEALLPSARLVLVGDPDQLPSVEAGAVLADLVQIFQAMPPDRSPLAFLTHTYRNAGDIARLATELRQGSCQLATALQASAVSVTALSQELPDGSVHWVDGPLEELLAWWMNHHGLPSSGEAANVIVHARILCATHAGTSGRTAVNAYGDAWLQAHAAGNGIFRPGRQMMLTRNFPQLELWNGDLGVVSSTPEGLRVVFPRSVGSVAQAPERLEGLESAWAMTVHKSQGSEFDHVLLLLPERDTPLMTRQILYTGLTRARRTLLIHGDRKLWERAAARQDDRPSRLRELRL